MGKRKKEVIESDGQMALIDVAPENIAKIIPVAKKYRLAVRRRMKVQEEEVALKTELLELVKESKAVRLADGSIRFRCEDMTITVTPRDELVKVKDSEEES
jgi:tRNA1(Val) A37 N6-methylase TrmN6